MVILFVVEPCQQRVIIAFFAAISMRRVFECGPKLALEASDLLDLKIRLRFQYV